MHHTSNTVFSPPGNSDSALPIPAQSGPVPVVNPLAFLVFEPFHCTFSHVHTLAISEFRKDFPFLADRLELMRRACGGSGSDVGAADAEGAAFSVHPDGNHGDNQTNLTDKAVA